VLKREAFIFAEGARPISLQSDAFGVPIEIFIGLKGFSPDCKKRPVEKSNNIVIYYIKYVSKGKN